MPEEFNIYSTNRKVSWEIEDTPFKYIIKTHA